MYLTLACDTVSGPGSVDALTPALTDNSSRGAEMADSNTKRFRRPSHWTLAQTIAHYTAVPNDNGCMLWAGTITDSGYGILQWDGRLQRAHRLAWISARGAIAVGLFVCHRCDVPTCINPDHLFLGTPSDNTSDMTGKGRAARGRTNGYIKLAAEQILAIRADSRTHKTIAADYAVAQPHITRIKRRTRWGHL